ncbi:MAG: hypothetical protein KC776_18210 [Myxococcales bacterium]|nr:hypothetical protein [Myxococcales bacterium]MCB9582027.1 hypothetical protein [Polyangiaceae bacterium]
MPSPRKKSARSRVVAAAGGASWMALLAATTLGVGQYDYVQAEISSDGKPDMDPAEAGDYRLVVQSYASGSVDAAGMPALRARPLGSVQRAITSEELEKGIAVKVVQVGPEAEVDDAPVLIAWVERGQPNLEFDALRARPTEGALVGVTRSSKASGARVVLSRRDA